MSRLRLVIGVAPSVVASAKDGLGRMCRSHWTEYTRALRKASVASKAAEAGAVAPSVAS